LPRLPPDDTWPGEICNIQAILSGSLMVWGWYRLASDLGLLPQCRQCARSSLPEASVLMAGSAESGWSAMEW